MRVFVRGLIFVYFPESPLTPPKPPLEVSVSISGDLSDPDATLNDTVFSAVYPMSPDAVTVGNEVNKIGASEYSPCDCQASKYCLTGSRMSENCLSDCPKFHVSVVALPSPTYPACWVFCISLRVGGAF